MENKYFKVTCKCGHVGRNHFVRVSFPVIAQSAEGAASMARYFPRVKHDHKYAIIDCVEIAEEEFLALKEQNDKDPYLKCTNLQEQDSIIGFSSRIEDETSLSDKKRRSEFERAEKVSYKIRRQKQFEDCLKAELFEFLRGGIDYELFVY